MSDTFVSSVDYAAWLVEAKSRAPSGVSVQKQPSARPPSRSLPFPLSH